MTSSPFDYGDVVVYANVLRQELVGGRVGCVVPPTRADVARAEHIFGGDALQEMVLVKWNSLGGHPAWEFVEDLQLLRRPAPPQQETPAMGTESIDYTTWREYHFDATYVVTLVATGDAGSSHARRTLELDPGELNDFLLRQYPRIPDQLVEVRKKD
jgi:hypothetical protein